MPTLRTIALTLLALSSLAAAPAPAEPLDPAEVPAPLQPWIDWALHGADDRPCPLLYDSARERRCAWPSRLRLELTARGGRFAQTWRVYRAGEVELPGDARHWPQGLEVDGAPASVGQRGERPVLWLEPGEHRVEGRFEWRSLPESLSLPPGIGLVDLRLEGREQPFPEFTPAGDLWLRTRAADGGEADRVELQVLRRIIDEIPLQVETRLELDVAGGQRELLLGPALLPTAIPVRLDSPLPARLEADGRLRLQLRPGRWTVTLASRLPGPVEALGRPASEAPWPQAEVWAFDARPQLRLVEVEGVTAVDPHLTRLPPEWQSLPAYRVLPDERLRLKTLRRGAPEGEANRLELERTLWLDFDGGGYSFRDRIGGHMASGWRLESAERLILGQALLDGRPQLITRLPDRERSGVEIRQGRLDLRVDGRIEGPVGRLPATGWAEDFQSVRAWLQLPPGWSLLGAGGVDSASSGWLQRWTLLDLFLVLVAAVAVARLAGWGWGALALGALALSWHEPGAPRLVWLNLLAAVALLRVLPQGRLRRAVGLYRGASLLALVLIALPFLADQLRTAIYPQLERPATAAPEPVAAGAPQPARSDVPAALQEAAPQAKMLAARPAPAPAIQDLDPEARVQTGPGLPDWRWTRIELAWSGPVDAGQELRLWLISPGQNLLLKLLRVGLVLVLGGLLSGVLNRRLPSWRAGLAGLLVLGLTGASLAPRPAAAQLPGPELLEELQRRLLAAPDCAPLCAQSPRMELEAEADRLRLRLELHAQTRVAVPLPGRAAQWLPTQVLVDGRPAEALARDEGGRLWLAVEAGRHELLLQGPLPDRAELQLALPLRPKRVSARLAGWSLQGLDAEGRPEAQLQLLRRARPEAAAPALEAGELPPFVRVERSLVLGLDWRVHSRAVRLSPGTAAAVLALPLLPGESVLTEGLRVEDGKLLVNLAGPALSWESVLEPTDRLELTAAPTNAWVEYWRLDAAPLWHVESAGLPPVHARDPQGRWLPEWRPWPGESLRLSISRPQAVPGQTLTIDGSRLELRPGRRSTEAALTLRLRSSQGGQHVLRLPEGAELESVSIDGQLQPIRALGREVTLPLVPAAREVVLRWREPRGMQSWFRSSAVDLGMPSVNARLALAPGADRWILLTGGPLLGPAVLFWGVLLVVLLAALALGRVGITPLRTWQWLLLGLGLTQAPPWAGVLVVGWLLALGGRGRIRPELGNNLFNLLQIGLALLTLLALGALAAAIQQGLLGQPEMQIAGNGSSAARLLWYQDRAPALLPQAWVLSVPLAVYRLLMLAWALWLAFALLGWLRWGWGCYSRHGLWRAVRILPAGRARRAGEAEGRGR